MKIFRWACFAYMITGFLVSLFIGERFMYYATGLFGYTPMYSEYAEEDLQYYEYQGFGCKLWKGGLGALKWTLLSNFTYQIFIPLVKGSWALGTGEEMMCEELFDGFGPSVWMSIQERLYDVNYMCTTVSLWDDYYYKAYDVQDYVNKITRNLSATDDSYPKTKPK